MTTAIVYGLLNGFSLLTGAVLGLLGRFRQNVIARFMAFGSGVLICAISTGLMEEAFGHGGFDATIVGFLSGGLVFIAGDYLIHVYGGRRHRRKPLMKAKFEPGGSAIVFGAVLDGIPESIALGISLALGKQTGMLLLAAIILSNLPEGISSITGLVREGYTRKRILLGWFSIGLILALISIFSFFLLRDLSGDQLGVLESFAAGAIMAMIADTMIPEAYEEGGFLMGFLTVVGFLTAFIVAKY